VEILKRLQVRWSTSIDPASLRLACSAFGLLMVVEALRYLLFGWVDAYYVEPQFHFTYPGFSWVEVLSRSGMVTLFVLIGLCGGAMMWRWHVKKAAAVFCLAFGYVFLIDQTYFQNHLYLVWWLGLFFVLTGGGTTGRVQRWMLDLARFQVGVVYVFGGMAKLNGDWLAGQPMALWLDRRSDWLWVGEWLAWDPMALILSIAGLLFDLTIVPFLLWPRTRRFALFAVILFHVANTVLFHIGIFPFLMVAMSTLFLGPSWCRRGEVPVPKPQPQPLARWVLPVIFLWVGIHLAVPLRHWFIPGDVAWTEEGHRFSWRMKTRSKVGKVVFHALDRKLGTHEVIDGADQLTVYQVNKMATHPQMIRQFAQHLAAQRKLQGSGDWAVHVDARARLNHRPAQSLIDPSVDLVTVSAQCGAEPWIISLD
jgi:vitamin K-dependent gamma-carboxylase